MSKLLKIFLIAFSILCLLKTIYNPSLSMAMLTLVSMLMYIQNKYVKNSSIYNAMSFFMAGITLIVSYTTSEPLFSALLSFYSFMLMALIAIKIKQSKKTKN